MLLAAGRYYMHFGWCYAMGIGTALAWAPGLLTQVLSIPCLLCEGEEEEEVGTRWGDPSTLPACLQEAPTGLKITVG